jgi:superfamily II DNA or RNA helicase
VCQIKLLLEQWTNNVKKLFPSVPVLIVSGSIDNITDFLSRNSLNCIVITTYSSSYKVYFATQNISFVFDMKINDECHHLTTANIDKLDSDNKTFIQMLNITHTTKQLSLTATIKQLEDKDTISNTNIEYFGETI